MQDFSLPSLRERLRRAVEPGNTFTQQIERALDFAYHAHTGQYRDARSTTAAPIPYIVHPVGVAVTAVSLLPHANLSDSFEDVISACLTHDVLEDTSVTLNELESATSTRCAKIVLSLTKPPITTTKSRLSRNANFLQQIVDAGATAGFVKLCDAIHNLSRPSSTPAELLKKIIAKSEQDYRWLLENSRFGKEIAERFNSAIDNAMRNLGTSHGINISFREYRDALEYAIDISKGKTLEEHDITVQLAAMVNSTLCIIENLEEIIGRIFGRVGDTIPMKVSSLFSKLSYDGDFVLDGRFAHYLKDANLSGSRLLIAPFGRNLHAGSDKRYICVAVKSEATAGWLDLVTLKGLVAVLSERLRDQEALQLYNLAQEISSLGLALDPGIAQATKMSRNALAALRARIEAAEFVLGGLKSVLGVLLEDTGVGPSVERVDSRVKSANSIVGKIARRGLQELGEIDDLVGVRVVLISAESRTRFREILSKELTSSHSVSDRLVSYVPNSLEFEEIDTTAGYRATHVRFKVAAPSSQFDTISCEVQLRTVFEDVWARLSQMVSYKRQDQTKHMARTLSEIAELCAECDKLVSRARF